MILHYCMNTANAYNFAPVEAQKYCDEYVCLSVCSHINHTAELHQIFCACCPWPWFSPPQMTLRYTIHFHFFGRHHVFT